MRRLAIGLFLIISCLFYFFVNKKPVTVDQDFEEDLQTFRIGSRLPAGKLTHQTVGKLPMTIIPPSSNTSVLSSIDYSDMSAVIEEKESVSRIWKWRAGHSCQIRNHRRLEVWENFGTK